MRCRRRSWRRSSTRLCRHRLRQKSNDNRNIFELRRTMRRRILLLAGVLALPSLVFAAPSQRPRVVQQFTTGWRFLQADAAGAEKPGFNDSAWVNVTLPHDWSIAGPVKTDAPSRGAGAFAPTGVGWYR